MRYRVTLTFVVDDEGKAWDIAEGLEQSAIRQNFREINAWAEPADGRSAVLGDKDNPPRTEAATIERKQGGQPASIGGVTLGGDDGRSG